MLQGSDILNNYSEFLKCVSAKTKTLYNTDKYYESFVTPDFFWPNLTFISAIPDDDPDVVSLFERIPAGTTIFVQNSNFEVPSSIRIKPFDKWTNMWIDISKREIFPFSGFRVQQVSWVDSESISKCEKLISQNLFSGRSINLEKWATNGNSIINAISIYALHDSENNIVSTLIGFSGSTFFGIYFVATETNSQGRGYGYSLINSVLQEAYNKNYQYCVLSSTRAGLKLYKKVGFTEAGEIILYYKF